MTGPLAQLVPDTGDARRAAVLTGHYLDGNPAGLVAILEEAHDAGRILELIVCLSHLVAAVAPGLRTDTGRAWLTAAVNALAEAENAPPGFQSVREW